MKVHPTPLAGLLLLEPQVLRDERGFFIEAWRAGVPQDAIFVGDNLSRSERGVVRGLHYQVREGQGKLVTVVRGAIWDVAVDLRRASPTFGAWHAEVLSDENRRQMWIPVGFAHGFLALSDADVWYKITSPYRPVDERVLKWDDPDVGIAWPLDGTPRLSAKDVAGTPLRETEVF